MAGGFGDSVRQLIYFARAEMVRLGRRKVSLDGMVLGILRSASVEGGALYRMEELGVSCGKFRSYLEASLDEVEGGAVPVEEVELDRRVARVLQTVRRASKASGVQATDLDVLYVILSTARTASSIYLLEMEGLSLESFQPLHPERPSGDAEPEVSSGSSFGLEDLASSLDEERKGKFNLLDYCTDLTEQARVGDLDPVVGRERELERLVQVLCRRRKNNAILVGEPGVGKSALVEGLAQRIAQGRVPARLRDKRLLMLDMGALVAGTRFRGDFEERMHYLIRELSRSDSYILFIDEVHTIVGAGAAQGSPDGANLLKPALSRGHFRCIGATTPGEYRKSIEADGALDRRFQRLLVQPNSHEETLAILRTLKDRYESFHRVRYSEPALVACVRLTARYLPERHFPDKAIDVLDETGARVALRSGVEGLSGGGLSGGGQVGAVGAGREVWIEEEMVAETVSLMANVPVQRVAKAEVDRLLSLEGELAQWVVGQREAIELICRAIRRNRSGLKDPHRPVGSFLFLGPTGVGKTSLAKALAASFYESGQHFVRVDMSEYNERSSISRLVGAPPGYVGYDEGGQLTERVRRNPYSVVLFDEIEKAAPEVYNVLLQVLDEGILTDGLGRTVDFTHAIIIMTSNVGSRLVQDFGAGVGYLTSAREDSSVLHRRDIQQKALERHFPPEFLNRVDELVFFRELTRADMPSILDVHLRGMVQRLLERGVHFRMTPRAREFVLQEGYNPKYGARPLKRAVQRLVEDQVAEFLLREEVSAGDTLVLNHSKQRGVHASLQRRRRDVPPRGVVVLD